MRPPEQNDDNDHGSRYRTGDVVLHSSGDFSDKSGPARVVDDNLTGQGSLVSSGFQALLDFSKPGDASAVARQLLPGLNKDEPECALRGGEQLLAVAENRCAGGGV